jgi:hypothetical protein
MTLTEKKETCLKAFLAWIELEKQNKDVSIHSKEVEEIFTSQVILKKFKSFNIDIVLPDMLLLILAICTDCNPGQFQVVLKDLLNNIKSHKGPIPEGYIITVTDFSMCFPQDFPFMDVKSVSDKYHKLWDAQKKSGEIKLFETDNLCDTPEWWREVME